MSESYKIDFKDLHKVIQEHLKGKEKQIKSAITKTKKQAVNRIRRNAPRAFGELRNSIHVSGDSVVIDAPHAAAVEVGSRPHWIPLDKIVKWVRLRGIQYDKIRSHKWFGNNLRAWKVGTTTLGHAISIGKQIESMTSRGSEYDDSVMDIAKAIQNSIAKNGTLPHFFIRKSMPHIESDLINNISEALRESVGK